MPINSVVVCHCGRGGVRKVQGLAGWRNDYNEYDRRTQENKQNCLFAFEMGAVERDQS